MIVISPSLAFMIYLGFMLSLFLSFWLWRHFSKRKHKIILSDQDLCLCEYCHFTYLAQKGVAINSCPQCGSYNKNNFYDKGL